MISISVTDSISSFDPIVDDSSKVLILGTIPGPESLRLHQYYANRNNQFWSIIYKAFGEVFNDSAHDIPYEERVRFLLTREIALWDVFHTAIRPGALDSKITGAEPNDIPGLLLAFPRIERILLAGRKAEAAFLKYFCKRQAEFSVVPNVAVSTEYVPSTSPAYAKITFDDKLEIWRTALHRTYESLRNNRGTGE